MVGRFRKSQRHERLLRDIEAQIAEFARLSDRQRVRLLNRVCRLRRDERQRMARLLEGQIYRLRPDEWERMATVLKDQVDQFGRLSPEENQTYLTGAQWGLDAEADEIEKRLPSEDWYRALRLARIAGRLIEALIAWGWVTLVGALVVRRDYPDAFTLDSVTRGRGLWICIGWAAIGLTIAIAYMLLRGVRARDYERLAYAGCDPEDIALAVENTTDQAEEKQKRATERDNEERWQSARDTAPPWWRRETSGGHLLLNVYIVAGALVAAIPTARGDPRLVSLIPLFAIAAFVKFVIPMIALVAYTGPGPGFVISIPLYLIVWAFSRTPDPQLRRAAREAWLLYSACGRSRAIIGVMLAFGLIGAGIGLYVALTPDQSALTPGP